MLRISIIGSGAWGSALGLTAHRAGSQVTMVGLPKDMSILKKTRQVPLTDGIKFPEDVDLSDTYDSLSQANVVVIVVPAQDLRQCLTQIKPDLSPRAVVVVASKGIEQQTNFFMGQVVKDVLSNPLCVLSGPNFAKEVIQNLPACTVVASEDALVAERVREAFHHIHFRPYIGSDVIGVQVVGAVKNVLAIGCGIVRARGLGENAMAALVARGLDEIKTLGVSKGADIETFLGLAGVGDVMLTCMSAQSRNFQLGLSLGRADCVDSDFVNNQTVEGFYTVKALKNLAQSEGIDMPVSDMIYHILYNGIGVTEAIEGLLNRPLK